MQPTLERVHARELVRSQLFGDPRLRRGSTIGRYHVRGVLGRGGLGVVYRVYDPLLDREVAVKLLHGDRGDDPQARKALLVEAQHLAQVSSPNIVPVFDVGEVAGHVFLAMELVSGENLRRWLRHERRSVPEILRVFLEAANGLVAMHTVGLVHRDFKPENVLIGHDG
ncbi:MAG TPA: serine/threonine-protein kinase, partial [Nannocystaceae bacterium]|nr:serine/threonine-protein kinase [Nannocystaceae bacterium]